MSALGSISTAFGVIAFVGALAGVALHVSSLVWTVGLAAGIVLMVVGLVYTLRFLLYPGLLLVAFAGGAALGSWAAGAWNLPFTIGVPV